MNKVYIARSDGTIYLGDQPRGTNHSENKNIFEDSLNYDGWYLNYNKSEPGLLIYSVGIGDEISELYVYLKTVRSSSRGRSLEHRIQLNASISKSGFINMNQNNKICVILGVYTISKKKILCTWDPLKKNNDGRQKSCYIDIRTIAKAMRDGFAKRVDNAGDIVYAFEPQFLRYYIVNINNLHSMSGE